MTRILEWVVRLFAGELTADERRKFARLIWDMVLAAHVATYWGGAVLLGTATPMTAAAVDDRIAKALQPVLRKLDEIAAQLERSNENQRRLLTEALILKIRDLQKQCLAATPESALRARLAREIISAQYDYRLLEGEFYPMNGPQCD